MLFPDLYTLCCASSYLPANNQCLFLNNTMFRKNFILNIVNRYFSPVCVRVSTSGFVAHPPMCWTVGKKYKSKLFFIVMTSLWYDCSTDQSLAHKPMLIVQPRCRRFQLCNCLENNIKRQSSNKKSQHRQHQAMQNREESSVTSYFNFYR